MYSMELAVLCSTSGATFCSVPLALLPLGRLGGTTANRFGSQLCLPSLLCLKELGLHLLDRRSSKVPTRAVFSSPQVASLIDLCEICARFIMIPSSKLKRDGSQIDLFSSCRCLKQASSLLGCTARASRDSWINKMRSNLLRYQCGLSAQCTTVATRCDDICENTVLLKAEGPCGSVRRCHR